jgi:hypothetical protein
MTHSLGPAATRASSLRFHGTRVTLAGTRVTLAGTRVTLAS